MAGSPQPEHCRPPESQGPCKRPGAAWTPGVVSCVTLGKTRNFSELPFPHRKGSPHPAGPLKHYCEEQWDRLHGRQNHLGFAPPNYLPARAREISPWGLCH